MSPHAEGTNSRMLFANFNQDFTSISVGTDEGYIIVDCDPFGKLHTKRDGPRGIAEMLFSTSLLALVGAGDKQPTSPRTLHIVNTRLQTMICELVFPSSILAVKLNRKTLVVILETEIYIYDVLNTRLMHVIETTPNPEAVAALSPNADASYLAYPSPIPSPASQSAPVQASVPAQQSGDVILFSTQTLTVANVIQVHKSPISFLSINSTGTLLATSSDKGMVIRVWGIPGSERLYQFRRRKREARIYSMNFNIMSTLLAVSFAHHIVQIFKLEPQCSPNTEKMAPSLKPSESIEIRNGIQGLDSGYYACISEKKSKDPIPYV